MLRDEMIRALQAQPENTDVQVSLGGMMVDIESIGFDHARCTVEVHPVIEDMEDVIYHVAKRPWWRGNQPSGFADTGQSRG